MSIINGLLTGGVLIGKICQALGGFSSEKKFTHQATGISITGEVTSGGVTFYRKELNGTSMIYAANPSTKSYATIVIPNEGDNGGVTYFLNPLSTIAFAEAESVDISPMVNVTTGLTDNISSFNNSTAGKGSLLKLAFNGLKIGKNLSIGSFKLSCNTTQLIIVSSQISILSLNYLWLESDKGISASSQNTIKPDESLGGPSQQTFTIDFMSIGIDPKNDLMDGQITFETNSESSDLSLLSKIPSQPFDAAELEYFSISK